MNKKREVFLLVINIIMPAVAGFLAYLLTKDNMNIYNEISVPRFAPPAAVFPFVWSILYILSGYSFYLVSTSENPDKAFAEKLNFVNIFFNFFWTIIFFNFRDFLFAFVWIVALWAIILWMIAEFYPISKKAAAINIPYLLWVTFAAFLNYVIASIN